VASAEPHRVWVAHALDELHTSGYKWGSARRSVVETLGGRRCCMTAQQIADELRAHDARVGVASVYRALELLARLDLVRRVDVGDGSARYEPALPGGEHHHHVVCERCGRVTEFADDGLERAIAGLAARLDYAIEGHDVVLRGTCPGCRA
jgi:Fur family ferric uptake transcriptional regulator